MHLVLLPGMDGTGDLFAPFLDSLPADTPYTVVRYPSEKVLKREALIDLIAEAVPRDVPYCLIAESFSGPLAMEFAARRPQGLASMVLCATFCRNPLAKGLRWIGQLAKPLFFEAPLPNLIVRRFFVGEGASSELVSAVQQAVRQVRATVLASRARMILDGDLTARLSELEIPVLYLEATKDRILGSRGRIQMEHAIPHARFESLDAPHLLLQSAPDAATAVIQDFLKVPIRAEQPGDHAAVHSLHVEAFETTAEADLVDILREEAKPMHSLVAEIDGKVVGHILFTPVDLEGHPDAFLMGLAPMAVSAGLQRQGIGTALVQQGLMQLRKSGCDGVVVLGHPDIIRDSVSGQLRSLGFAASTMYQTKCSSR